MNFTVRRIAVFMLAFIVVLATMHVLTFPAAAMSRSAGETDPGIVTGEQDSDPEASFDNGFDEITDPVPEGEDSKSDIPEDPLPAEPAEITEASSEDPTVIPESSGEPVVTETEPTEVPAEAIEPEAVETPQPIETPAEEVIEEDKEPEEESDPEADVEDAKDWEDMFRDIELTGVWADDLITLAETQIGYKESTKNFIRDEGKKYGYSRYGEWYGDPYAEWDSLFVMFTLSYAGITPVDFPYQADCEDWIDELKEKELFHEVNTYIPAKGDLVFADADDDGETDHVAIVKGVIYNNDGRPEDLVVIEGDIDNAVKENRYEFYIPLITGFAELPENPLLKEKLAEAGVFTGHANDVDVTVEYEADTFPVGTTMEVRTVDEPHVIDAISDTVAEANNTSIVQVQAVDITFLNEAGREIEPLNPIRVTMKSVTAPAKAAESPLVVHMDDEMGAVVVDTEVPAEKPESSTGAVTFEADKFSVYAIVYTVDFHYEVDGKEFEFNLAGGGFISFTKLVDALGICGGSVDTDSDQNHDEPITSHAAEETEVSSAAKQFAEQVMSITFSNPEVLSVSKVIEDTTVGKIKEDLDLECEYSSELTEVQIDEINNTEVEAGDWALISMKAFVTEEALTVTMKSGEVFTIRVTDALHVNPDELVGKEIVIFDKTENRLMTSAWESNQWRTQFWSAVYVGEGSETPDNSHWTVEKNGNSYYLRSHDGRYLNIDNTDVNLVNTQAEATPLTIQMGGNPDYRIYAQNDDSKVLTYSENNEYNGFFAAPGGTGGTGATRTWLGIDYAVSSHDRVGDWLLYFDDDHSEVTVHVGETITLRPYNKWEWKEGNTDVQNYHWNIGAWSDWTISGSDPNGSKKETRTDGCFEFTRYVKEDTQLNTHYWSLQGRAIQTGDYVLTNTKNGRTITVHVVDGDPVNRPRTVDDTVDIKVNLFDYDRSFLLDPADNNNLANNNNNKWDSTNLMGGGNHFYFLSSGSGNNAGEPWNSYTKDHSNPGIVQNELNGAGYPVLNHGNHSDLGYLFDPSKTSWNGGNNSDGMIAYPNVGGMFRKDSDGYYYYNSNTNYFYYNPSTGTSSLYEHTYTQTSGEDKGSLVNDKPIGFFPFHEYDATQNLYVNQNHNLNHHLGMTMEIPFKMNNKKTDDQGNPIKFEFTGDDDLWVFAEWEDAQGQKHSKLLLDLGGIHQPVYGYIDFTNDKSTSFQSLGLEPHVQYKLKVFYLERGGCDSNLAIRFNLPITNIGDVSFIKKDSETKAPLPGAVFGLYTDPSCRDDYKVRQAVSDSEGHVAFRDVEIGTYYMKELSAPDGYEPDETIRTVVIKPRINDFPSTIDGKDAGYTFSIENTPKQLTVTKVWVRPQGDTVPSEIYFRLYRNGTPDEEITAYEGYDAEKGYRLDESKGWTKKFKRLPNGTYYVVEQAIEGYSTRYAAVIPADYNDPNTNTNAEDVIVDAGGSLSIINFKNTGDLELKKKVSGNHADTAKQFEFTIELTASEGQTLDNSYPAVHTGDPTVKSAIITDGKISGIRLKDGESYTIRDLPAGTVYKITESDYTALGYVPSVTVGFLEGTITAGTKEKEAVEVTNTFDSADITIKKVAKEHLDDPSDNPLCGASFRITKFDSSAFTNIVTAWGDNGSRTLADEKQGDSYTLNGVFPFENLPAGYYELEETVYPAGYVRLSAKPRFELRRNEETKKLEIRLLADSDGMVRLEEGKLILIVGNEPGMALPHTGGPGSEWFRLTGIILVLVCGLTIYLKKFIRS